MARAIDVDRVKREIRKNKEKIVISCKQKYVPLSLIYEILNKAPTLTPPNEWVSVDERLPENHAQVLMWSARWNIAEAGSYYNRRFWVYSEIGDGYIADDITHWMLLPTPPDRRPPEVQS